MKVKIKDFYIAGLVIGVIGGIIHNILLYLLIAAGLNTSTYWKDMAQVFFNPPEVFTLYAQLYGLIASLAMAGVNGFLIATLLKITGRDYLYIKSISASSAMGFTVFMVVYPALGLDYLQHSINTNYVALFTFIFYGGLTGFLFDKFTDFSGVPATTGNNATFNKYDENKFANKIRVFKTNFSLAPKTSKKPFNTDKKRTKKLLIKPIKLLKNK